MSTPFGHSFVRPDPLVKATWLPWALVASVAEKHVGEREESRNRSPFILRLWRETWADGGDYYEGREPWCAAFVCWCIKQACAADTRLKVPFEMSPSVHSIAESLRHGIGRGGARIVPWREAQRGDVITFLPSFSHIGIVDECCAGGLITIEGNTNDAGSREGDGVYRKQRAEALVRSCDVWRFPVPVAQ